MAASRVAACGRPRELASLQKQQIKMLPFVTVSIFKFTVTGRCTEWCATKRFLPCYNATHVIVRSTASVGTQCPAGEAQNYPVWTPMRAGFLFVVPVLTGVLAVANNRNSNCKLFSAQLLIDRTKQWPLPAWPRVGGHLNLFGVQNLDKFVVARLVPV